MNSAGRLLSLALVSLFVFAGPAMAAALHWEAERVLLSPEVAAKDAEGVFQFTNRGDATVRVVETRASCGCTVAALTRDVLQPGESGEIRALYHIGEREGRQSVTITVTTDEAGARPYELTLEIEINIPVHVVPRFHSWRVGDDPAPKLFEVMRHEGWRLQKAVSESGEFTVEVITLDDGTNQLRVAPQDTLAVRQCVIRLKLTFGDDKSFDYVAWARVY
jgi:hypothetical protein